MKDRIIITGTQIAYFTICHRKLWLFTKNISMEHTSELVEIGKIMHENSYKRKRKEVNLEGIKIDILETKKGIIHEVKKSRSLEDSHIMQMKYYLYYLKKLEVEVVGIIDYPKLRKREIIKLSMQDIENIELILNEIKILVDKEEIPPKINKPYCKKCSYYEFCYC